MEIHNWYDLIGLKSDNYKLDITPEWNCGYIIPIKETEETLWNYWDYHRFLSPLLFSDNTEYYTKLLKKYGFNVIIIKHNKNEVKNWFT